METSGRCFDEISVEESISSFSSKGKYFPVSRIKNSATRENFRRCVLIRQYFAASRSRQTLFSKDQSRSSNKTPTLMTWKHEWITTSSHLLRTSSYPACARIVFQAVKHVCPRRNKRMTSRAWGDNERTNLDRLLSARRAISPRFNRDSREESRKIEKVGTLSEFSASKTHNPESQDLNYVMHILKHAKRRIRSLKRPETLDILSTFVGCRNFQLKIWKPIFRVCSRTKARVSVPVRFVRQVFTRWAFRKFSDNSRDKKSGRFSRTRR